MDMRLILLAATVGIVLLVISCGDGPDVTFPSEPEPFDPPNELYLSWYSEVVACAGEGSVGDYWRIRWFTVDDVMRRGSDAVLGAWKQPDDIILSTAVEHPLTRKRVVQHEMTHHIAQAGHEHPAFRMCAIN